MKKKKIELQQISDNEFRVVKLTNRITPAVGSVLNEYEVKRYLQDANITVTVIPLEISSKSNE